MLRTAWRHCHGPLRLHSLLLCLPALIGAVEPGLAWSSTEFAPSQGVLQALQPILYVLLTVCQPAVCSWNILPAWPNADEQAGGSVRSAHVGVNYQLRIVAVRGGGMAGFWARAAKQRARARPARYAVGERVSQ
jgi:hypothetical protein